MQEKENHFTHLLNRYLKGDISDSDKKQLLSEIEKDKEKKIVFEYSTSQHKASLSEKELLMRFANQLDSAKQQRRKATKTRALKLVYTIAAIALLFGMAKLLFHLIPHNEHTAQQNIISTSKGEKKHFFLSDGTEIWLNAESKIIYSEDFGQSNRNIKLIGEAYFSVVRNENIPLIVKTDLLDVKVLGTIFNIRAYKDEQNVETALIEGKIQLSYQDNKKSSHVVSLEPGDKVTVHKEETKPLANVSSERNESADMPLKLIKEKVKTDNETLIPQDILWKDNILIFDSDPVAKVVSKLEKWYNKTIVIQNKDLLDLKFSGTFENSRIEEILDIMRVSGIDLTYSTHQDTLIIN